LIFFLRSSKMLAMENITRRAFCQTLGALGASLVLGRPDESHVQSSPTFSQSDLRSILGMHGPPFPGGNNIPQLREDLLALGISSPEHALLAIDPSPEVAQLSQSLGITLISRVMQPNNRLNEHNLRFTLNKLRGLNKPRIVVFNEPIHVGDQNPITPEEHADEFIKATELALNLTNNNVVSLLTPMTPHVYRTYEGSYFDEIGITERMLNHIVRRRSVNWILEHTEAAYHWYYFLGEREDNHWGRPLKFAGLLENTLNTKLPIHITEAGIEIPAERQRDDQWMANQMEKLITLEIPEELQGQLKSVCIWILSNYAQMDPRERERLRSGLLDSFEIQSLRRLSGITPSYRKIAEMMRGG
jgi:hypothetical protein